jgi:hypothetical protein
MLARGYLDGIAEFLQPRDEPSSLHSFGPAVEVVGTEIVLEGAVFEHVVGGGEDRGGESADRLFGAAPGAQAMELGLEIAGVFAGGRPGALDQGGLEIRCPTVGKRLMSPPISARMTWALKLLTPGMVVRSGTTRSRAMLLDEHRRPTEILPFVSRIDAGSRVVECPIAVAAASSPTLGRGSASIAVSNVAGTSPPQRPRAGPI